MVSSASLLGSASLYGGVQVRYWGRGGGLGGRGGVTKSDYSRYCEGHSMGPDKKNVEADRD